MLRFLRDKKKWEEIRNNPKFKPLVDELWDGYKLFCENKEIPVITYSDEMDFVKTGNRTRFEDKYFLRRQQLTIYALLSMIYPEKDEYILKLQDVICEICNEYSWQVTAHRPSTNRNKRDGLALFSCETGLYLAEIKHMLIDRLDSLVVDRITAEIDRRILKSFENEHNLWIETLKSNWASVCGGSIGMTFMYESPERFYKISSRIDNFMKNYLEGISEDGATSEGAAYWNYGFCFYVMYYDNLMRYTNGRTSNVFRNEKVKRLANFYSSLFLDNKTLVSFSDSSAHCKYHMWLLQFLKAKYDIVMPPKNNAIIDFKKFSAAVRAFLYYNPDYMTENINPEKYVYEELGWYIDRKEKYGLAIKAGNNGEEHNHNDIGSFIVASGGKQILCDLGAAEYTAFNFGKDRYTIFNNSSLGHSVPIIDGKEQGTGKDFYGTLTLGEKISVDMKNAYPVNIEKLIRNVELSENKVIICDEFDGISDIKERFVTEVKPVISENKLIIGNSELSFDKRWKPQYSVKNIESHNGTIKDTQSKNDKGDRTVYILDFVPTEKTDKFTLSISF